MKDQDKGERCTSSFELPQVRSSMELRRQFTMKREHIIRNLGETTAPQGKGYGQIQVPKGKRSKHIQSPNRQPMIKMVAQDDVTKANLQTMQKAITQYEVTSARQRPIKKVSGENGNFGPSKQTMNRTVVETEDCEKAVALNDCARPKQQLMKRVMAENESLRVNQQVKKGLVVESDSSRATQQPVEKVVTENDNASVTKKTKKVPMCKSMLIDEFLKENGDVIEEDEEELGDESDEELNAMEQEENTHQEEDGEVNARNVEFCPLIYTNFKALLKNHKEEIWEYVNDKYIIPDKGQKAVFSRINDAWRSYKSKVKKNHYKKYSTLKERLKNRPVTIP
ncbi:hypothetical protein SESBI_14850 [Sesbania bispinosa]|nr:hypothetical protein SESBI_14850 [Sesbania bispinosa]